MMRRMNTLAQRMAVLTLAACLAGCHRDSPTTLPSARLVTGHYIAATFPATQQDVGSLPVNIALSADRRFAITLDQGYRQALTVIDVSTGRKVSEVRFETSKKAPSHGLYYGLLITPDNTVYAAMGAAESIAILKLSPDGTLTETGKLSGQVGDFPSGLALDSRGLLFTTSNEPTSSDTPLNSPGAVIAFDTHTNKEAGRVEFDSYLKTTNFPLAIVALADGSKLFVSSQRDACIYTIDATHPAAMKVTGKIATGANPVSLLLTKDEKRLYVANADSDTLSVIDVATSRITATILLRPEIARGLPGVSPLGLALSPDERTLYAACADLNAVAVIDTKDHELEGYLPAGWYPTAVATDGRQLLTVNAKGTRVRYPNPQGEHGKNRQSPNNLIEGNVFTAPAPSHHDHAALAASTRDVLDLAHLTPRYLHAGNPLKDLGIKHVVYVIKENRTYDQVLGDLPQGNGDPTYTLFGGDVTPNQHALAERFVLLDNFYDSGEVSGDGWVWSTEAMATQFTVLNVPYNYSGRGRQYDSEANNNDYPTGGFPALDANGQPSSQHPLLKDGGQPIADAGVSPGGHIWDLCTKHNLSFRNYGFFVDSPAKSGNVRITPDNYPSTPGLLPASHDLAGLTDVDFRRFDMDYADSDAPENYYNATHDPRFLRDTRTYGKHLAPSRFTEWKTEFDQMLANDRTGKAVPAVMFVRFPADHTVGMSGGKHTPKSMVADNDYAVGQIVETISHSAIWPDTAIFIIEDDAQNGPDHIDAHRSACYVISAHVIPHTVDHTFHNTVSCIRTMELLLGLPPMNGYDASAVPMQFWSKSGVNADPFTALLPDANLIAEKNPKPLPKEKPSPEARLIRESEQMNFAVEDKAPADALNRIIWASVKGTSSIMPSTPQGPIDPTHSTESDDDK